MSTSMYRQIIFLYLFIPREKTTEIKRKTSRLKATDYVGSPFRA